MPFDPGQIPSTDDQSSDVDDLYFLFALGTEIYATKLARIRELLEPSTIRSVPGMVDCFEGLMNVRGEIIAVVDLRGRFHLPKVANDLSVLIVFDSPHGAIAARVDRALKVTRIPNSAITKQPNIATPIPREYLLGATEHEGKIVAFIDLELVLSRSELAAIQTTVQSVS